MTSGSNPKPKPIVIVKVQRSAMNTKRYEIFGKNRAGIQHRRKCEFTDEVQAAVERNGGTAYAFAVTSLAGRWIIKGLAPRQTW